MNGLEALEELAKAVNDEIGKGATTLSPEGVLRYIDLLKEEIAEPDATTELERRKSLAALEIESIKMKHTGDLNVQTLQHASDLEAFRATVAAGTLARKDLLIANGGACVALLALLGHFVSSGALRAITPFVPALIVFASGAALAVLAGGFTYASQWCYQHDTHRPVEIAAWVTQAGAIVSWLAGGCCFAFGAFGAATAFLGIN